MTASVWDPGSTNTAGQISADNTYKSQYFTATEGQVVFNLTAFTYTIGTESLQVLINGVDQIINKDYTETTGASISLVEGVRAGDIVRIRGLIGSTGAQAATLSAYQAYQYATNAQQAATAVQNVSNTFIASGNLLITIGTGNLLVTVPAGKQFQAGQFVLLVDTLDSTRYLSGQVVSYVGTNLTFNVTKTRGAGNINSWNLSVSGIPEAAPDIFASDLLYAQVIAASLY